MIRGIISADDAEGTGDRSRLMESAQAGHLLITSLGRFGVLLSALPNSKRGKL